MQLMSRGYGRFPTNPSKNASFVHHTARRHFVSPEVLRVLRQLPWFPAVVDRYAFQPFVKCEAHSDALQEQLVHCLHEQHLIDLVPTDSQALVPTPGTRGQERALAHLPFSPAQAMPGALTFQTQEDPGTERIAELAQTHGPLSLTMARALGPNQGERLYHRHHAMVVLFCFFFEGEPMAVVSDGNDLQQNEVMDWVHAYADRHDLGLEELTASHRQAIRRELPGHLDMAQLCFRLIELRSMVRASRLKYLARNQAGAPGPKPSPNLVRWVANARVRFNPLPPPLESALQTLCRQSPQVIERFNEARPGPINRDE